MFARTILGLDIGSYAVKIAELRAGLRGVEFLRIDQLVLPPHASPEEREATIQIYLEQNSIAREFVVSALSAERATQRHLRFPFTGKRVLQAIPFEVEEDLPVPLENVVLTHEHVLAGSDQTDVLAVLAPRSEVELHLESMRRMELEPRTIEVEGAVLANLSNYLGLTEVGRLLIDIGHSKTTLCLLVDGKPSLLRTVPVAGRHLTEAIARDQRLPYDAAQETKHQDGLFEPMSTKPASQSIGNLLDQLVRETMRSLQSVVGDPLDPIAPGEIVLVGGTAQAAGLDDYFEERTGLPTRLLEVPEGAEGSAHFANAGPVVYAHAAALALRGSTTERVTQMDLRQGEFSYTPDLSGLRGQLQITIALFGLVLALWVASLGAQLWSAERRGTALREAVASLYQQTFPNDPVPQDAAPAFDAKLRETRELANHLGVIGGGISVLEVLREISDRIPANLDISLSDLRLERRSVRARGYAQDFVSVDRVRAELEKVDFFERVTLSDVVNEPRRGGKSFSLTIELAGNSE